MSKLEKIRLGLDDRLGFLRGFLESPKEVGSVIPSSSFLERRIVRRGAIASTRSVVELGSGTGGTTRALLDAMPADGHLLVIEINPKFLEMARRIDDPRLVTHLGSAEELVETLRRYDLPPPEAVVSGLPFSTIDDGLARRILHAVEEALAPGGRFVAYQLRARVADFGQPHFGAPDVELELLNIPPMRVFHWQKDGRG